MRMHYDPNVSSSTLVIRYTVGSQEREAVVLSQGFTLEEHVQRVTSLLGASTAPTAERFVPWESADGGGIAIRLDSIIAIETAPGRMVTSQGNDHG